MSVCRPNILILPRWYPNRYDLMSGLFVRTQAEALTSRCDVTVLYVHADADCPNMTESEFSVENGVNVIRVYYRPSPNPLTGWYRFCQAHNAGLALLGGQTPDLIHVQILTREGYMGYRLSRRMKVPFLISEHWSRYFPENDFFRNPVKMAVTRFIVRRSAAIVAVSGKLKEAMIAKGLNHPFFPVIPNVIDTTRFHPVPKSRTEGRRQVVHVSCFDDRSKNISGLLDAVAIVAVKRNDFNIRLVGEGRDLGAMKDHAERLGLSESLVTFAGLKEGEALVREYADADFSVVSSRFETFGTVIPESLSCGTPVLSTEVGIASGLISDENGLIVPPGDTERLAAGFLEMLERCENFDPHRVSASVGDRFSPETVASGLTELYCHILNKRDV